MHFFLEVEWVPDIKRTLMCESNNVMTIKREVAFGWQCPPALVTQFECLNGTNMCLCLRFNGFYRWIWRIESDISSCIFGIGFLRKVRTGNKYSWLSLVALMAGDTHTQVRANEQQHCWSSFTSILCASFSSNMFFKNVGRGSMHEV